ncbi:connector enhancer of kinase suppressor of ras 1 isoform X1 [Tamandua tetradactyla]|uniref:connector enhancer of kinase suppressor of ras 1 isoform X1 n=1 Tax=Tamandua tetradactyla TaxID=48850 RepID=UPI00405386A7
MEPIATWTSGKVAAWLRGLDDSLQDYPFEDWELPGKYLFQLCPRSLEALTVWPVGHQELILDGVEQLQALSSGLQKENLQSLTEGLLERTHAFQNLVQDYLGTCAKTPACVLTAAVELVHKARGLLFWLNRYLFSHFNDFSACQEIGQLCGELVQALQEDCPAAEKETQVLRIVSPGGRGKWGLGKDSAQARCPPLPQCSHVAGICCTILSCSPKELLEQKAVLERVQLDDPLGLEIHTTSNCLHFVSQAGTQVPAASRPHILPGDEVVQVNEQVVVGWTHKNVVRELLRGPAGASLVLKKLPVPESPPQVLPPTLPPARFQSPVIHSITPISGCPPEPSSGPRLPTPEAPIPGSGPAAFQVTASALGVPRLRGQPQARLTSPVLPRAPSQELFAFEPILNSSPGSSPAWTDPLSFGPEPMPVLPLPPVPCLGGEAELPEPPGLPDRSPVSGRKKSKGVATRLSRRRVSCRELGQPDCHGWLLLRKTPSGFMGPRWRRCWFVLKRHTLYWYRQAQDQKAEGLINVSNYSLESGHDQKKKYVFQLTHDVYKPFIFAADTLTDLSMWVRHLITCISKYQSPGRAPPPREEDCYSETEAEDPDDEAASRSGSPSPAQAWSPPHRDTSPAATPTQGSPPSASFGSPPDGGEGTLEGMVQGLRQGGVSLLGQPQPLTHEQWRSSFMRRSRDPRLNEQAHRVRALQSTLKAKLHELQVLEEVLGDPELTGEKFRRWKEQNQELYSEGLGAWGVAQAANEFQVPAPHSREHSSQPLSSDHEEHPSLLPLDPNEQPPTS